jgi:metal-dependent hydrolase (beta-lactamase superfamily II)
MMKNEQFLPPPPLIAEHGFSALIRVASNENMVYQNKDELLGENMLLFDCGTYLKNSATKYLYYLYLYKGFDLLI